MNCERFIKSFDGAELFVSVSGQGVPLVLCDGLACGGFIWKRLKPEFESRYQLVHWNYRGHGQSKVPADLTSLTIPTLVADLRVILDTLGIEKAVLLGHSMGCQVILEFALQHAARVAGLAAICGPYGRALDTFHDSKVLSTSFPYLHTVAMRWPRLAQQIWRLLVDSEFAYQLGVNFEVNGRLVQRADFKPYFEHVAGMDVRAFVHMATNANAHTVEDRLSEVKAPTLILAGERDSFTPVWLSRRMHQLMPGSELLITPGGTHVAPLELPEIVHARLETFLRERVLPVLMGKETVKRRRAVTAQAGREKRRAKKNA